MSGGNCLKSGNENCVNCEYCMEIKKYITSLVEKLFKIS